MRSILENPRYTSYAFFGRWTKHEVLLDPDDVGAGHVVRFRRATPDRVVRSRQPAHPAIVSVEDFTQAQLLTGIATQFCDCSNIKHSDVWLAPRVIHDRSGGLRRQGRRAG